MHIEERSTDIWATNGHFNRTCSMASARCLLSFCSLLRSFSISHCRSSTVVSISDTLVSELVTLSTNSLYCNTGERTCHHKWQVQNHKNKGYTHIDISDLHTSTFSHAQINIFIALNGIQITVPKSSYLHWHLMVSALQQSGQVSQTNGLL